jgi:hypothetical protein
VTRASELTHDQVHAAVDRLRRDPNLDVAAALSRAGDEKPAPLGFVGQLSTLADLGRQLRRLLTNLRARLSASERQEVSAVLADLHRAIAAFDEEDA